MLDVISTDALVYAEGLIPLGDASDSEEISAGSSFIHLDGSGEYLISINAVATSRSIKNGYVGIQLIVDGSPEGIQIVQASSDVISPHSMNLNHLIEVDADAYIGVKNVGDDAIYDAELVVVKNQEEPRFGTKDKHLIRLCRTEKP